MAEPPTTASEAPYPRAFGLLVTAVPLLVAAGAAVFAALDPAEVKAMLDGRAGEGRISRVALDHVVAVQARMGGLGIAMAVAAVLTAVSRLGVRRHLWVSLRSAASLPGVVGRRVAAFLSNEPGDAALVGAFALLALGLAAARLHQAMHFDEALTYMDFVRKSVPVILLDYSRTNNHVLHSLLAHVVCALLGPEPWALRMTALAFGVLCVPATYAAGRALCGRETGLLAAGAVASWPYLVDQAANARGYTMVHLAMLLLLAMVPVLAARPTRRAWTAFILTAAAGFYAVPVMIYPFATVALLVGIRTIRAGDGARLRRIGALGLACCGAGALTLLLYLPALLCRAPDSTSIENIGALPGTLRLHLEPNRLDDILPPGPDPRLYVLGEWSQLLLRLWMWWTVSFHPLAAAAFGAFVLLGAWAARSLAFATLFGFVGTGLVAPLPPPWAMSYLCVLIVLLGSAGVVAAVRSFGGDSLGRARLAKGVGLLVVLAAYSTNVATGLRERDRATAPWFMGYADAAAAAEFFADPSRRASVVNLLHPGGVEYHLFLAGVRVSGVGTAAHAPDGAEAPEERYLIDYDAPPATRAILAATRAELQEQGFIVVEVVRDLPHSRILRFRRR